MPKSRINVLVNANAEAASLQAADKIASYVANRPRGTVGLATGGTPVDTYKELIRRHRDEGLDFSQLTSFNLDEYIGLDGDHPQSFRYFMDQNLFNHVNFDPQNTHVPSGIAEDPEAAAQEYEDSIRRQKGIELQLLGLGHNGHIAFNEPGSDEFSRTRVVDLTPQTIQSNARFFDAVRDVPKTAITMGIGTILESQQIILLATGKDKAESVRKAVQGPRTENHPASLLQSHKGVTFILDAAAASKLK